MLRDGGPNQPCNQQPNTEARDLSSTPVRLRVVAVYRQPTVPRSHRHHTIHVTIHYKSPSRAQRERGGARAPRPRPRRSESHERSAQLLSPLTLSANARLHLTRSFYSITSLDRPVSSDERMPFQTCNARCFTSSPVGRDDDSCTVVRFHVGTNSEPVAARVGSGRPCVQCPAQPHPWGVHVWLSCAGASAPLAGSFVESLPCSRGGGGMVGDDASGRPLRVPPLFRVRPFPRFPHSESAVQGGLISSTPAGSKTRAA